MSSSIVSYNRKQEICVDGPIFCLLVYHSAIPVRSCRLIVIVLLKVFNGNFTNIYRCADNRNNKMADDRTR